MTDANLVLGRLDEHDFLGGGLKLDAAAARKAVSQLAASLGLGLEEQLRHTDHHQQQHGERNSFAHGPEGHRSARLRAGRFRGAGPLHGADVAAHSKFPKPSCRPIPASPRRSVCSPPI